MREYLTLRVNEAYGRQIFADDEGKTLDQDIRLVVISTTDLRLPEIREMQRRLRQRHEFLFYGWGITRKYEESELREADLFHLIITSTFEPAGEECGTVYDETKACKHIFTEFDSSVQGINSHFIDSCSVGATQSTDLFLDVRKIPKQKDIAKTIANEMVVSERLAEMLGVSGLTGFALQPVRGSSTSLKTRFGRAHKRSGQSWSQLLVTSSPVSVSPETRFGDNFFESRTASIYRCPFGHVLGLSLLSEVTVACADWDQSDIFQTKQQYGVHRGLLRPTAPILITPRCYHLLRDWKVRGYKVEVAHFS